MPFATNDQQESLDYRPRVDCVVCSGTGWVCEKHPTAICPSDCHGPEMPCEAPGCLSDFFRSHGLE